MANLSAYIDFDVVLDFVQNKIIVKDTGNYPVGVSATLKGFVKITQPDKFVVEGNFSTPDVVWNGTNLTDAEKELRRDSKNQPQNGIYNIVYTIADGVDITVKTKQFNLSYFRPAVKITPQFDVFTPELIMADTSNYGLSLLTTVAVNRSWTVQVGTVGSKAGVNATIDLAISGVYYDAVYTAALITLTEYNHNIYAYLKIKDRLTGNLVTTANTPPDIDTMKQYLKAIKARLDSLANSCSKDYDKAKAAYEHASALLQHINLRLCSADLTGLHTYYNDFLRIFYNNTTVPYVNTNLPITAYVYDGCGGNAVLPDDLTYIVGTTIGSPDSGLNTFTLPLFENRRVRLLRGRIQQAKVDDGSGVYFDKPLASDTLTLYGDVWQTDELVQIQFY